MASWPLWEQRAWRERGAALTVAVQAPAKPAHGRLERRELWALADPIRAGQAGELGTRGDAWPRVRQFWRLVRRRVDTRTGVITEEVAFGVSSLPPERADADRLLRLIRGYWAIENRLHYVRDVAMGEDASQVRSGAAPQAVAGLRNLGLALLRRSGADNIAERLRTFAGRPAAAVALVLGQK